jgi:predicted nucleic acid-binding protein
MIGTNYFLADTNFLINISEDNPIVYPFLDENICISYITEIELLGVFSINKIQKNNAGNLINFCSVIEMNSSIKKKVISLKQKYKIKIPDAIIAATAIVNKLPLITSDADFKTIKELELIFLEK